MKTLESIYLAAAIDHRNASGIVLDPFTMMAEAVYPAVCFNPRGAFKNANKENAGDKFVATVNFQSIQNADMVLAYVEEGSTSFGVPMELLYATAIGKPVVLIFDGDSGIYARLFSSEIIKLKDLTYSLLKEIFERRVIVGSNVHQIDMEKRFWVRDLLKIKENNNG